MKTKTGLVIGIDQELGRDDSKLLSIPYFPFFSSFCLFSSTLHLLLSETLLTTLSSEYVSYLIFQGDQWDVSIRMESSWEINFFSHQIFDYIYSDLIFSNTWVENINQNRWTIANQNGNKFIYEKWSKKFTWM